MLRQWLPPMIDSRRINDTALVNAIIEMMSRKTPEIFAAQVRALLARPDASAVLEQIRCPALLLTGREDGWSGPSNTQPCPQRSPAATSSSSPIAATCRCWSGPPKSAPRCGRGSILVEYGIPPRAFDEISRPWPPRHSPPAFAQNRRRTVQAQHRHARSIQQTVSAAQSDRQHLLRRLRIACVVSCSSLRKETF
jgi:hypothetical protein